MAVLGLSFLLFWLACFVGGIIFFFVVLRQRLKEKKREEIEHKDYKQY